MISLDTKMQVCISVYMNTVLDSDYVLLYYPCELVDFKN